MALTDSEIADLVACYPLPEGVPDTVLNRNELAAFFGVSAQTITSWINAGMPVLRDGGQGQAYEFQASACWAWRASEKARDDARSAEAQATIAAMRLALVGGKAGNSIQSLAPTERRQLYEVEAAYERLCRERNQSLDRDEVSVVMSDLMRMVRDGVSSLPDTLERVANLSGTGVSAAVDACDQLLDEMERRIASFFADRPVITRADRSDLFN